jgi:hypothetical protein
MRSPSVDLACWCSRTPEERIAALEALRDASIAAHPQHAQSGFQFKESVELLPAKALT